MFLSGLDNIDFTGIGGLSGDMSRSDLFSRFRSGLPPGITDDEINNILSQVLSSYEVRRVQISDELAGKVSDAVATIVIDVLGGGGFGSGVVGRGRALANKGAIDAVTGSLTNDGYALVPIGYAAPSQGVNIATPSASPVAEQTQAPVNSSGMPTRAAVFKYQATQQTQAAASAQPIQRSPLPVRRITRSHVQTPAEKKRLLLIIGGFGLLFVVALGVIASRD